MKKIDLKTINDYINGNDIEGFDIEELENDPEFMKHVLSITKDKNMYIFCSDELKNDINFIEIVASIFKNDEDFVCGIIDEFISNHIEDENEKMEAALLGFQYAKDEDKVLKYKVLANLIYVSGKVRINSILNLIEDKKVKEVIGTGFTIAKDMCEGYELSTRYYAKKMVDDIFDEAGNLEIFLHTTFKNADVLKSYGVTKFIVDYVKSYDYELAGYIAMNIEIVNDLKKNIDRILNNWQKFEERNNNEKFIVLNEKIIDYFVESMRALHIDMDLFIYYILSKYGIAEEYYKHDHSIDEKQYKRIMDDIRNKKITEDDLEFQEKVYEKEIGQIIENVIGQKVFQEEDDYVVALEKERNTKEGLILEFKANK